MFKKNLGYTLLLVLLLLTPFVLGHICKPRRTANFKECEVYPEQRCPDDEVRAHWSTNPDTPIKIRYAGNEVSEDGHGDYVIDASDVNSYPDPLEIEFQIDVSGGERRKKVVNTIHGYENIYRTGTEEDAANYIYKVILPDQVWSDDIYVYAITLISPKGFNCTDRMGGRPFYYHSFKWQFDKTIYVSDYLSNDNNYEFDFSDDPVQAQGVWYFTLTNPEPNCLEWEGLIKAPTLSFKVACKS